MSTSIKTAMAKKLFGTDGIRGKAGQFPLDAFTVRVIGDALTAILEKRIGKKPQIVTGRDTRESGELIEKALQAGISDADGGSLSAGVITTPGVAFLTRHYGLDAGIVVSASHNPYEDNGIKIFLPTGAKADEEIESAIEAAIHSISTSSVPADEDFYAVSLKDERSDEFQRAYLDRIASEFASLDLTGKKIVLDCSHGAASALAPQLFSSFGADVVTIHAQPNGRNINKDCGSLHMQKLQDEVLKHNADLGVAFDGDADRSLFVDENGELMDGDATLWIMANYLNENGRLSSNKVVATVMSNIGLELALKELGIELIRANVGDKYVLEALLSSGAEVGGEQSGHIIFPEISLVGDGMMTAMLILRAMKEKDLSASATLNGFTQYPQVLVNVKVREKRPFNEVPEIAAAAAKTDKDLAGSGRLLLRYSGTENLARVMIEGKDQNVIEKQAAILAAVIQSSLG